MLKSTTVKVLLANGLVFLLLVLLVLGGSFRSIKERGTLVVVTRNAPTTYYFNSEGQPSGPDFELVEAFAKSIGVDTEYRVENSITELLHTLRKGGADVAVAGLSITEDRKRNFIFSDPYQKIIQQVVCWRGINLPKNVEDLTRLKLAMIGGTSYVETLKSLKKEHPNLVWKVEKEMGTEELLELVSRKEIDCTLADSNIVDLNRRYYPELVVAFNITEPEPLVWVLPQNSWSLRWGINRWLDDFQADGGLDDVMESYYGYIELFDYVDKKVFFKHIKERYPRLRPMFEKSAKQFGLEVPVLAALGYQESKWNSRAKSPTGVRGIMMLTLPTAKALGVEKRLDPKQSIWGGAKYLAGLKARLGRDIEEPNLTWLALAAYNVGPGHLQDATELARQLGKDPHSWADMREVLPLLSKKKYYKNLRYGYARGNEPVQFVRRIRDYADILEKKFLMENAT